MDREPVDILDTVGAGDLVLNYELEYLRGNEPAELAEDDPIIGVIRRKLPGIARREGDTTGMIARTEVRNFIHDQGTPTVNFGPGDFRRVCHKPNSLVTVNI